MSSSSRIAATTLASALILVSSLFAAGQKSIRLRNETITTLSLVRGGVSAQAVAAPATSGLFLVQLEGPPNAEQRATLLSLGIDLLRYVPDDAWIARFSNVSPTTARSLPGVRWVGEYRAEHKVYRGLLQRLTNAPALNGLVDVSVMLAPRVDQLALAQAARLMQSVSQQSRLRQGNIWRGRLRPSQLSALAQSPAVLWIEPAPNMKLNDEVSSAIVAGSAGPGELYTQSLGFDGTGVTVAVADSGLDTGEASAMHPDLAGRTPAFFFYGTLTDASDEHSHGTHVTGIIAGNAATGELDDNGAFFGLGVAPGARIVTQRIFDGLGGYQPPPSFETMTRDAKNAGAEIGSNSWGDDTQGRYDASAAEFDELVRDANALAPGDQPYILEFSAGNAGPGSQTIGSPAVAKNVIATGAAENDRFDLFIYDTGQDAMADFSSRGPCEDGRIKPDITAPGTWISSALSSVSGTDNAWGEISPNYIYMGGTSQSGPHASGAAAVFVQYYRATHTNATPSPALVKAALINSAVDMLDDVGTTPVPNMDEGWGRIDLTDLIGAGGAYEFLDQTILLTNSAVLQKHIVVANRDVPLKITLTYTDYPGFPGAVPALVNDLDLEVVGPGGELYRGNQLLDGVSAADAPTPDSLNNVEGVYLDAPDPGEYVVRVRARRVLQDARVDTPEVDQDFALVISSDLLEAGASILFLDRGAYTVPAQVKLSVVDPDRSGSPSLSVNLKSTTEAGGETVLLLPANTSGLFTGIVATATGGPFNDGKLQVNHNDAITASYADASASVTRFATARADLVPPVLSSVATSNFFTRVSVTWTTDESSTSVVRYSTNASLAFATADTDFVTDHVVTLTNLIPERTYFFALVSVDEAGNARTNNNGGNLFSFVAPAAKTVLLVDGYDDSLGGTPDLAGYLDALDAVGVDYDVWNVTASGSPQLADLKGYRAVIWRLDGFVNFWDATERSAISNYLHSGGAFMTASMELLSRLEGNGGSSFIRDVLQVESYLTDETGSTLAAAIVGTPGETVGNGMNVDLDYAPYESLLIGLIGPDLSDTITPTTNAMAVLRNDANDIVGLRWPKTGQDAPGRLVFCSFPFDAVPLNGGVNDRVQLLRNILTFLIPGANGAGNVAFSATAFPVPGVAVVEVADSDLAGAGQMSVTAATATDEAGIPVTLLETARAGVFRGSFRLVAPTSTPTAGELRAQNGDSVWVDYFDASRNSSVRATATADTDEPVISGVEAEPGYQDAVVFWDTSEPCDALVQYGESPFLSRTAYESVPATSHEITLNGLLPDRLYYYRVVSRDAAGNTATDPDPATNQLHTFRTLVPVRPPWTDNMNGANTNWSIFTSDDSQSEWTLGVPNNGQETSAHSPTLAWGSNLGGGPLDYTETFLISPAIDLTEADSATLKFWHSYDFTARSEFDILEWGQVLLFTNNNASAITIAVYADDLTPAWEQETIDLSSYAGNVIYLVWSYQLLSFDSALRPGWLLDDVSLITSNVQTGTIVVTNNLRSPSFALTGPLNRNGRGQLNVYTNAPAGTYVLTFGSETWFNTPVPQTNTLAPGGTITFTGNYTITDSNSNGAPDSWETNYQLSSPTPVTDTDGDGVPDLAEFTAGTNPTNAMSKLEIAAPTPLPGDLVRLEWSTVPERNYRVEASTNLQDWLPVTGWLPTTGASLSQVFPSGDGLTFYRVQVQP